MRVESSSTRIFLLHIYVPSYWELSLSVNYLS